MHPGWSRQRAETLINDGFLAIGDGYRAKNSELSNSGLPFARAGNIKDGITFSEVDYFPEGDLHKVGDKVSRIGDSVFTSKGRAVCFRSRGHAAVCLLSATVLLAQLGPFQDTSSLSLFLALW